MPRIDEILEERGYKYGDYSEDARISQSIKAVMRNTPNWNGLSDDKKETLEMMAKKVARILNGDPEHDDSWVDVVGYVTLTIERLKQ
jgi:hypothetical protein